MRQTWRWFGPHDETSVDDMRQAGVEGVVTALHQIPTGEVWSVEDIRQRQNLIARMKDGSPSDLAWEVVESLPVSESIKKQTGDWRTHIANYKQSLANLRDCGIETICYNFMPVLDWTRTDLAFKVSHGGTCMRFDLIDFAAFDIHILKRRNAAASFDTEVVEAAAERFAGMDEARRLELTRNVTGGLPGSTESLTIDDVAQHLAEYDLIDADKLRSNYIAFLEEVVPVAEKLGMRLCCHPDDPPFPLLGLPRIMSTGEDFAAILQAVDSPASGLTLCSGSLGARPDNDLAALMRTFGPRVHFLHLRNVARESTGVPASFHEAEHLGGSTDMVAFIAEIVREESRRKAEGRSDHQIPMRPDHGQRIVDDLGRQGQPGYPIIGRLKGLAELRGVMTALSHPLVRYEQ
ncbi:mannonate dehydratase [Aureimonas fodinaquatilis]|uniref:Mannonate dehydratase n=1 Tax=Aureimonas fodinaquatilis TaxID=2565783 RepID=A0A5B0DSJ9_9HYPH|nr:mannonate dehydratase [Aureimonas fodinaquatilis]KAA0969368.1 mannonate dehydratase [Aureimonas fodinaquatilis]